MNVVSYFAYPGGKPLQISLTQEIMARKLGSEAELKVTSLRIYLPQSWHQQHILSESGIVLDLHFCS
jgi:hypothetical protein